MSENEKLTEERKEEIERDRIGSMRVVTAIIFSFSLVLLTFLWLGVFTIRQIQINKSVEEMKAADGLIDDSILQQDITTVRVHINDNTYSLKEFTELDEIPTTVNVLVYYEGGSIVEKPSYVSYDEVDTVEYIDNTYGRIIVPNSLHK